MQIRQDQWLNEQTQQFGPYTVDMQNMLVAQHSNVYKVIEAPPTPQGLKVASLEVIRPPMDEGKLELVLQYAASRTLEMIQLPYEMVGLLHTKPFYKIRPISFSALQNK